MRKLRFLRLRGRWRSALVVASPAEPMKKLLREQTEEARSRGIFGGPTFFACSEMFWGNDRLDDALLFASERFVESSLSQARQ